MDHRSGEGLAALSGDRVTRHPLWLTAGELPAPAWLHLPADRLCLPNGVVYCPPVGFEYSHAHRTGIHFADALAASGIPTLRIDYPGTGDSHGDEESPRLVEQWLASISEACSALTRLTGAKPSLAGLRLGGTLAAWVAETEPVLGLALWAPVAKGRRFERELRALHAVASDGDDDSSGFIEAGGFRYSEETLAALGDIDLTLCRPSAEHIMLVEPNTTRTPKSLLTHLESLPVELARLKQSDFADVMAEPQFTHIPDQTIGNLVMWFQALRESDPIALSDAAVSELTSERTAGPDTLVIVPSDPPLAGVLTSAGPSKELVVVLPNAGSVHHAGPNRLYVELARALAEAGVSTLRVDLGNLGNSRIGSNLEENHPYPSTATADIAQVNRWLVEELGYEATILSGLCSGAHAAFHGLVDLEDQPVLAAIAINPLTFNFRVGMSLDTPGTEQTTMETGYYRAAIRDLERWRRLLTGHVDVRYVAGFVVRFVTQRIGDFGLGVLRSLRIKPPGPVEAHLSSIERLDRSIHFVFSDTDPGPELLRRQGGRTLRQLVGRGAASQVFIPGGDHTFSRKMQRSQAIAAVVERCTSFRRPPAIVRESLGPAPSAWGAFQATWSGLLETLDQSSAFLSTGWIEACLDFADDESAPKAIVWRSEQGHEVACTILWRDRGRLGPFTVSRALLNSPGIAGLGIERNEVLALPDFVDAVNADLGELLEAEGVDEVDLVGVPATLLRSLRRTWSRGYWNGYESVAPYVDLNALPDADEPYLASLSSNTRSQIRRSVRGYTEKLGQPTVRIARDPDEALEWFSQLLDLHDERWREQGVASGFVDEARAFHGRLIAERCTEEAWHELRTDVVRVAFGDTPIGFLYHLVHRGHVHFMQSGFVYSDDAKLKPGMVSHYLSITRALADGMRIYDFLGGAPEPVRYTTSLSNAETSLAWAQLPAPTLRMDALEGVRRLRRRLLLGPESS